MLLNIFSDLKFRFDKFRLRNELLTVCVEVKDQHGKRLTRKIEKSHSYVIAWNNLIYNTFRNVSTSITDTGGVSRTATGYSFGTVGGVVNNSTYGVVIGTGNTGVTISDYALSAQITHGTGAGQMTHYAAIWTAPSTSGATRSFTIQRVMTNNSGAQITVAEAGIYLADASYYYMIIRDVLGSAVAVPNLASITVTYTIKATV